MGPISLSGLENCRLTCLLIGTTSSDPLLSWGLWALWESMNRYREKTMKAYTLPGMLVRTLVYAAVILALAGASLAQITTTGIRGIVRDQTGAVIPNATIKITDSATGIEHSAVSSSDGGFLFPNLQFGSYKLSATASGFQTTVIAAITVESGRATDVSVDMKVGATGFLNYPFFQINTDNASPISTSFGQITSTNGTRTMQFRISLDW
jgi:Carboxypeptidase regulatory-like domain